MGMLDLMATSPMSLHTKEGLVVTWGGKQSEALPVRKMQINGVF